MYFTNDFHMNYDLERHRYVLKPEAIRDLYAIELISALDTSGSISARKTVEAMLNRASSTVYNFIYSKHPNEVEYWTYRLVKHSEYRRVIEDAMAELVYYWLTNNNDLSIQSGISINAGKLFERIDALRNTVPVSVEQMLYNSGITVRARTPYDADYVADKATKGTNW
jgi:hypothetical protein